LEGTLFRNGPGLLEIGGVKLNQPFDGDGMVLRFAFNGAGSVHVQNAFVRTAGYVAELAAGKMLFKGAFATGNPGGGFFFNPFNFDIKNVANTHVLRWGKRLFALWEGGLPHELDPVTLATLRESDWCAVAMRLRDALLRLCRVSARLALTRLRLRRRDGAIAGGGPFAAHFKVVASRDAAHAHDRSRDTLVNFGAATAGEDANVTFYEFDAAAKLIKKSGLTLKGAAFGFFHDFLVTPNYYVLFQNPMRMDVTKLLTQYMLGRCGIAECLVFDASRDMQIHVIARPKSANAKTSASAAAAAPAAHRVFALPPHFVFHHINAFEDERGGSIVCDSVAWRSVDFSNSLNTLSPGYYGSGRYAGADQRSEAWRYTLPLDGTGAATRTRIAQRPLEFPAVAPAAVGQRHAHAYACGAAIDHPTLWGPAQTLVKLSSPHDAASSEALPLEAAVWAPGPRKFTQEPVFVPRPGGAAEDDGWLLALVHDAGAQRTELVILDARRVEAGPVATLRLRHVVPFGLHGSWSDAFVGPSDKGI
jgi:all-trans-8'-apo-beta-carotenal 15,15'-oxygenase